MIQFSDLGLAAPILRSLEAAGYQVPTAIQAKAIPLVLAGRDLLGIAQTGTGKTAAFALPIIQRLTTDRRPPMRKGCRVMVLAPTRELASQTALSFRTYGGRLGLTVAVVFGGVGHRPQVQALARGVDVLVATPGRLIDHIENRDILLSGTEILVLDEADQMLDLGFLPPIRRITGQLSSKRQNLFFSATMPQEIGKLARELLRDPESVAVTPVASTVETISQLVLHVESQNKRSLLVQVLSDPQVSSALVFTRTKRGADKVARHLDAAGIRVATIHGNKSQAQREQALDAFRQSRVKALVATDIAARGIDIDRVTHVVNFELPDVPENYVHRIGRTARAGARGTAISLCDAQERNLLRDIERLTRQSIPAEDRRQFGDGATQEMPIDTRASRDKRRVSPGDTAHRDRSGRNAGGTARPGTVTKGGRRTPDAWSVSGHRMDSSPGRQSKHRRSDRRASDRTQGRIKLEGGRR